jgi:hypothetical protein
MWNSKAVLERIIPCPCPHAHVCFHVLINIKHVTYARPLLRTNMFLRFHRPNSTLLYNKPSVICTDPSWYVIFAVYTKPRPVFDSPKEALLVEILQTHVTNFKKIATKQTQRYQRHICIISYHVIYFRGSVQDCKSIWVWKMVTSVQSVQNNYNIWYINYMTY